MNYNFTDRVRKVLAIAREEALRARHDYVGPEHILLGVVREGGGVAAEMLQRAGTRSEDLTRGIEERMPPGRSALTRGELPYTSMAKKVLELAIAAARGFNHSYVGTEHLLLALVRQDAGIAAEVLRKSGLTVEIAEVIAAEIFGEGGTGHAQSGGVRESLKKLRRSDRGRSYAFTDRTRKVLALAREEALSLQHDYVGTEHILLALLREGEGVAATVLQKAGIAVLDVRQRVLASVRPGRFSRPVVGELPYTSRAKKSLELAMAAARGLNHSYVGPEHILLGLLIEEKGIAAQVLENSGLTVQGAEAFVMEVLREVTTAPAPAGFEFRLDDTADRSIYEQIIGQVQEAVATGALNPGERLPPVRQLADQLDIAPGTVARAYSELERRGVVVTEGARGTRVAEPTRDPAKASELAETLSGLLRPTAVAAFHLGATADQLRAALERAMGGIFDGSGSA